MATGIRRNDCNASFHLPPPEVKAPFRPDISTRINPLNQQSTTAFPKYSVRYLAESIGSSLFELGVRCLDIAKETLLMKADEFSKWAYEGLKDITPLHTKTPFEIDYVHDKIFWQAHFCSVIDELSSFPDQKRLEDLQDLVWAKLLSPYQYEEGLKDLDWPPATLQAAHEKFRATLKNCPVVIEKGLQEDLRTYLKTNTDLEGILDYYRLLMNPLDYKEILTTVRTFLQKNKAELSWTQKTYQSTIAVLNEAIDKTQREVRRNLRQERAFFNQIAQELPFYFTEINTKGVWADVKDKVVPRSNISISQGLIRACRKSFRYIIEHPLQATTTILATQVVAIAALNALTKSMERSKPLNFNNKTVIETRDNSVLNSYSNWTAGSVFQVNQAGTLLSNAAPSITALNDGNVLVAWQTTLDVKGRIIASNGSSITDEFIINQTRYNPSMIALNNENIFVAWTGGSSNVFGSVIFPNGTTKINEFLISQHAKAGTSEPSIVALNNGDVFVAWVANEAGSTYGISGRVIAPNGTAVTNEIPINEGPVVLSQNPSVALLNNGNIFLAWCNAESGDLSGIVVAQDGIGVTNEFPIFRNQGNPGYLSIPSIAALNSGNVFVIWCNEQTDYLSGTLLGPTGSVQAGEFLINSNTKAEYFPPSMAVFNNTTILVVWGDAQAGALYGVVTAPNGSSMTSKFLLTQRTPGSPMLLSVSLLNNENVFVTWYEGKADEIYGCILTNSNPTTGTTAPLTTGTTGTTATTGPVTTGPKTTGTTATTATTGPVTTGPKTTGTTATTATTGPVTTSPKTTGTTATTATTGPVTTSTTGTTGTTATTATTGPVTTGPKTTGTTATTATTGPVTTSTTGTTGAPVTNPTPNNSFLLSLIAGLAGLGGITLIVVGGVLARRCYRSKCSSRDNKTLLNKLELGSQRPNLFAPSVGGFTTRPAVMGTLNKLAFALWEQISEKEASSLEKILYRKIPFLPDSSNQDQMSFYLGKGQFGETFLASNLASKELVAVKRIRGERQIKESLQEGQLQNRLKDSPHIMSLLDYLHFTPSAEEVGQEPYLFQFMPLAIINGVGYKALAASLATKDSALHRRLLTTHTYQLLKGLNFMHNQWIYHSDMKDANILFMSDFTLKIADFGRALELGRRGIVDREQALGDRRKFAPEQVAYIRHSWKKEGTDTGSGEVLSSYAAGPADLWSGALFMLETLAKNEPFDESIASFTTKVTEWTNASFQKVVDQEIVLQEASGSNLTGLIKKLLQADPEKRLDGGKALKWPVFKTLTPLNEEEGAELLKRLMRNPKVLQQSSSKDFDPYAADLQQEREAYYKYRVSQPSAKNPDIYGENREEQESHDH